MVEGPCGLKNGRIRDGTLNLIRKGDIVWSMLCVWVGRYKGVSVVMVLDRTVRGVKVKGRA